MVQAAMQGTVYTLGRITLAFKAGHAELSLVESTEPPGAGAGLHRHPGFVETFVVLGGRYEFTVDGTRHELVAGDTLAVPRGAPHAFTCTGPETGRLLTASAPGGVFEAFIREVCAAMIDSGKPGGAPAADFRGIAARHGIEFL